MQKIDVCRRLEALGASVPEILLPRPELDPRKWAVVACDQFTQDRAYWEAVSREAGTDPSAFNLILPEIYLEAPGRADRIRAIHRTMETYLREGVFAPPRRACIYLERATAYHPRRRGLVLAIDLEQYDWRPEARLLIRTTEGTAKERLLPRMDTRRGAALELPHILLLIDDEEDFLLPGLAERAGKAPPVYNTPLMMDSGHITGWYLDREDDWAYLAEGLEKLARKAQNRYGADNSLPFLYAVGDGNHSLAAAKAVWEDYKTARQGTAGIENHPARWALVEIENLYDPGLSFEPIHRVLFGVEPALVLDALSVLPGFSRRPAVDQAGLSRLVGDSGAAKNRLGLITGKEYVFIESDAPGLATDSLQPLLDALINKGAGSGPVSSIDYIHGEEELFRVAGASPDASASPQNAVGLLLPPVKKGGLFETVARRGPLPRKSFSMGEAGEKRFYLECRRLFG